MCVCLYTFSQMETLYKKKKDPKTELNFASLSRSDSVFLSAIPGMLKFVFTTQCVPPPGKKCLSAV